MKWLSSLLLVASFNSLAFDHFISRQGHQLFDGKRAFRFAGIHAPELHRIEDDAKGKCPFDSRGWGQYFHWPTAEEQENWIKALVKSGHKAMRIYTLSVAQNSDVVCQRETHISAPLIANGMPQLDEKAMVVYDRMIALADQHKLRLILPFIDHWEWWGGRKQLAAFYNESEDDFYDTGSKTFAAYLHIIEQVITRTNTLTGRRYFNEKAIMAWETGNELKQTNWLFLDKAVAQIKRLAPHQLIVDGTYLKINEFALSNPDIDIISNHFYSNAGNNNPDAVRSDLSKIDGRKAYLLGEFGLADKTLLSEIMETAVHFEHKGARAVGAFVWGFRGHRHNGGFYYHQEHTGHFSYRIPGFKEADENQERDVIHMVRKAQAQLDEQLTIPALPVPEAPRLRPIKSRHNIHWMGSPVGRTYRIERAAEIDGPWQVLADNVSDGKQAYNPRTDRLFSDNASLVEGKTYYYRVIASNESGSSEASNIQSFQVSD